MRSVRPQPEELPEERHDYHAPRFRREFLLPVYWGVWLGVGFLWVISLLPSPVRAVLGALSGEGYRLFSAKRRSIATINVAMCFPEMTEAARAQLVRRHFQTYGKCLLDFPLLWFGNAARIRKLVRIAGLENYETPYAQGRRIILLTAHFVALEFGAAAMSARFPLLGMIKPMRNPLLDWFMANGRKRFDPRGRMLQRDQGLRPVIREIERGLGFYYLPDEDFGTQGSTFVPFLGTEAARLTTLGRLAGICDAVVIPCFTYRLPHGKGYEVRIGPALAGFPSGDLMADTRRMNAELERHIRSGPEQYMWTFKYFKTRPGGGSSPYEQR
ncbi:MAG: LpxL/LpxP family acyltransferase [Acidiferrobacterales bacterium]